MLLITMHVFACHFVTSQEDYVYDVRYLNLYFRVNVRNFSFRLSFTVLTVSVNCKFNLRFLPYRARWFLTALFAEDLI